MAGGGVASEAGRPSVNVSGTNGFCTIERVDDPDLGYEFLTRFFVRSTGNLAVTIRLAEVEHVFCPGLVPGEIVFADGEVRLREGSGEILRPGAYDNERAASIA